MAHAELPRPERFGGRKSPWDGAFPIKTEMRIAELTKRLDAIEETLNKNADLYLDYLKREQVALSAAIDLIARSVNERTKEISFAFSQENVAATQTNVALVGFTARGYCTAEAGSIVGVTGTINAARTAGTLTLEPIIIDKDDGTITQTGLTVVIDGTNARSNYSQQDPGSDIFDAGDIIGMYITTTGTWAPTTADLDCAVWCIYSGLVR